MVLKDRDTQKILDDKGIAVAGVISPEDVEKLFEFFQSNHCNQHVSELQDFYISIYSSDYEYKKRLSDTIGEIMNPYYMELFEPYKRLVSAFQVKPVGLQGEVQVHQDWTLTDEKLNFSVTVWTPLCDSDEHNGTLHVLETSHRYFKNPRGGSLEYPFFKAGSFIKKLMKPYNFKAGSIVVFYNNLIHASPPNKSGEHRISVISSLMSHSASPVLYYHNKAKCTLEQYQMPDDFYLRYNQFEKEKDKLPAHGLLIKEEPDDIMLRDLSEQQFLQLMESN